MKSSLTVAPLAALAIATLAACASTDAGGDRAAVMCMGLATAEGLRTVSTGKATAADGAMRVPMRVEDRVGRRVDASCTFANGQARWTAALPAGLTTQ